MTGPPAKMRVQPITIAEAKAFVQRYHRHHDAPTGAIFAVALGAADAVIGVAMVGRPVARAFDDGWTAEVIRVCVLDGHPNACSKLYTIAKRAAQAMGYRRVLTYTLASEPGSSLRAAGWQQKHLVRGRSWSCPSRPRVDTHPLEQKQLWEAGA